MKKGEIYTGIVEKVDFPNKGILHIEDEKELELKQKEMELKQGISREASEFLIQSRKTLENLIRSIKEGEITREKTLAAKQFISQTEKSVYEFDESVEKENESLNQEIIEFQKQKKNHPASNKKTKKADFFSKKIDFTNSYIIFVFQLFFSKPFLRIQNMATKKTIIDLFENSVKLYPNNTFLLEKTGKKFDFPKSRCNCEKVIYKKLIRLCSYIRITVYLWLSCLIACYSVRDFVGVCVSPQLDCIT